MRAFFCKCLIMFYNLYLCAAGASILSRFQFNSTLHHTTRHHAMNPSHTSNLGTTIREHMYPIWTASHFSWGANPLNAEEKPRDLLSWQSPLINQTNSNSTMVNSALVGLASQLPRTILRLCLIQTTQPIQSVNSVRFKGKPPAPVRRKWF